MIRTGSIFTSYDYNEFKKLEGNREIFDNRKNIIIRSIKENGWIRNPIVVNEKMEIIDGQGRFEALKELDMPIEFVVAEGATIEDCISLNVKQKNWMNADYVKCYADLGNKEYILFQNLCEEYKGILTFDAMKAICSGYRTDNDKADLIKTGRFVVSDQETIRARLSFISGVLNFMGPAFGRKREWAIILNFVFYCSKIDTQKFIEKIEKYPMFLVPCVTSRQILECFEKIYNYNDKKTNKVYFIPEYEKWKRNK